MTEEIIPNEWVEVGNGYNACIKQGENDRWEVWVLCEDGHDFRSAWNLDSEQAAADNLTGVVTRTYGDERVVTPHEIPVPRSRRRA